MKVNLGSGRNPMPDAVNIDRTWLPGVDFLCDLDLPADLEDLRAFLDGKTITEVVGLDLIEHIHHPLPLMQALWSIVAPEATCTFVLPYGSSDDAWTDPTHVRPYFIGSWIYFAQPTYWRADYGYRGDWQCEQVILDVRREAYEGVPIPEIYADVMAQRNVVIRQEVQLRAVKPAREPKRALMSGPTVNFRMVDQ